MKVNVAKLDKPNLKKKMIKTEIILIRHYIILVRSTALIIKVWIIMQIFIKNFQKTSFSLSNFYNNIEVYKKT